LLEEITPDDWQRVININIGGVFYCTQQAFAIMKDQNPQGGRIINNGSISAQVPRPNSAPYTASKHAVTGLTRSTSLDGRKYNIACGQIDIGNAETKMASAHGAGVVQANGDVIAEPMLNPQIVANAVVNMANLPLEANVQFMTVMATKMPYIGRG
jgi:NAD(P)-dependent dehydrogenase (short-subunit alcohol dehydrogenase family)